MADTVESTEVVNVEENVKEKEVVTIEEAVPSEAAAIEPEEKKFNG